MKRIWKGYRQHRDMVLVLLGLLAVSLIVFPYLVLGEGSYVQVHDQLDGEVLNYMYQARYLGKGNVIPQFMNGMDKASMLPPAPLGVLLYRLLPPFAAYGAMHWLCLAAGFLGMYSLSKRLGLRREVGWAIACLFCYIPFYPTYGLAALGQPMLVLAGLNLGGGSVKPAEMGRRYLAIALYGACSSLTLIGYAWVAAGLLCTICLAVAGCRKKSGFGPALRLGGGAGVLLGVYLAANQDLLRTLWGKGFTTHRQEMVLRATEHPVITFKELLFKGGAYSPVYSTGILTAAVLLTLVVLAFLVYRRRNLLRAGGESQSSEKPHALAKSLRALWGLIGLIFCGVLLAVLWNSGPVVSLRLSIGGMITYFQADRIYWCFPFLWMLVLGVLLEGICRLGECFWTKKVLWKRIIPAFCCLAVLGIEGLQILRDSTLNKNIRLMLFEDYEQVTWESIYMDEVFARIDQAIGPDKDRYSVVSLGIYPSVALYHGYTCADGYSNNYDLAYKQEFRRIMARELEENPEALRYFDEWGNRLYLSGAPYGINGMVPKDGQAYTDLDYDLDAMHALNIRYLLSAAPVKLSQDSLQQTDLRLELLEGSPFTNDTAYYEVWVYRITASAKP